MKSNSVELKKDQKESLIPEYFSGISVDSVIIRDGICNLNRRCDLEAHLPVFRLIKTYGQLVL